MSFVRKLYDALHIKEHMFATRRTSSTLWSVFRIWQNYYIYLLLKFTVSNIVNIIKTNVLIPQAIFGYPVQSLWFSCSQFFFKLFGFRPTLR